MTVAATLCLHSLISLECENECVIIDYMYSINEDVYYNTIMYNDKNGNVVDMLKGEI